MKGVSEDMPVVVSLLPPVIAAVTDAAKMLVEESRRPDGPRGAGDKADIDVEIEKYLTDALTAVMPCRLVGEETDGRPGDGSDFCWLVDPHDGTRAWLQGYRGSAVSVALLHDGEPILGVVCSPMSPDRGWDLIAWAEGLPHLLRNGTELRVELSQMDLRAGDVVFLSHDAAATPVESGTSVAPARFVSLPSIAYRLARVAAGDGVAAVSLNYPEGLDYAGGHALLRAAGGVLLDEAGREVTYSREGVSQVACCFGGAPKAARILVTQSSRSRGSALVSRPTVALSWPRTLEDDAIDRAKGCLFGQVIGDNLGGLVEFRTEQEITSLYPDGVTDLSDGGWWGLLAGQATDDSELALTLARTLLETRIYDREAVAAAYCEWYASMPFDIGFTTRRAFSAAAAAGAGSKAEAASLQADAISQSNGSLMRVSPIGIWARRPEVADRFGREDSRLSHPNEVCVDACGVYAAAITEGIRTGDRDTMLQIARDYARTEEVAAVLALAEEGGEPEDYWSDMGWVLIALQNAFCRLRRGENVEAALVATVGKGGDTDTNDAIVGALLGAADGLRAMPHRWVVPVLACRPHHALGAKRPRPMRYWPDDLAALAEALLVARAGSQEPLASAKGGYK